ncbi:MAG: hypothetical protein RR405_02365 [Clostridia bacterium]
MDRYSISDLRIYYGALLSDRQNEMLKLHYDEDISFGELSEMFGISRQAAFDAVKKGENALIGYEEKLKLVERDSNILSLLQQAKELTENGNIEETSLNIDTENTNKEETSLNIDTENRDINDTEIKIKSIKDTTTKNIIEINEILNEIKRILEE